MPADPEMPSWMQWAASLLGLAGGGGAVAKTVLNASAVEAKLKAHSASIKDHDDRLDASEKTLGILVDRSETAVRDRREILDYLERIEVRMR